MFEFKFKEKSEKELERFCNEVLDKINAVSGSRRKKMYKLGHGITEPKDSFSITYGYCNNGYLSKDKYRKEVEGAKNLYETTLLTQHPELKEIFQQLCDLYCKEKIVIDQVQINKNWQSPPHKDAGNVGESWIIGLGNYTGGETIVEYDTGHKAHNIKNYFTKFNGSKFTHWTMPWEGTRYSLVFYNHSKASKSSK